MKTNELNIFQKMSLITEEMAVVEKKLKVQVTQTNSYKAVSERDILDAVKPLEKKYGVYSYPLNRAVIDSDVLVKEYQGKTTNTLYMRIETIYRFVNVDKPEEYVDITTYGDGLDTGDKAPGKAMTYGDKYALMKAYKISTGDDPDAEPSPQEGYSKKKAVAKKLEVDYNAELKKFIAEQDMDINVVAKMYKLNAKSTNDDFKNALDDLRKDLEEHAN